MQHGHVIGINHIFEMLQPVAGNDGRSAAADRGIICFDEFAVVHVGYNVFGTASAFWLARIDALNAKTARRVQ